MQMGEADTRHPRDVVAEKLCDAAVGNGRIGIEGIFHQLPELEGRGSIHTRVDHEEIAVRPFHQDDGVSEPALGVKLCGRVDVAHRHRSVLSPQQPSELSCFRKRRRNPSHLKVRGDKKDHDSHDRQQRQYEHDPQNHSHRFWIATALGNSSDFASVALVLCDDDLSQNATTNPA